MNVSYNLLAVRYIDKKVNVSSDEIMKLHKPGIEDLRTELGGVISFLFDSGLISEGEYKELRHRLNVERERMLSVVISRTVIY